MLEVKHKRRNLLCAWPDHQKAYDSIPHSWVLEALCLTKVSQDIFNLIEKLTKIWSTQIYLNSKSDSIITDVIKYMCGVIQGDTSSVLLLILSLNPLSFLLKDAPRYKLERDQDPFTNVNHLFFIDDLKLFATTINNLKLLHFIVSKFSKDTGMSFGLNKCAYVYIERGKSKSIGDQILINGAEISQLEEGDLYKYLGVDEDIAYDGPLSKEEISKEFLQRTRKIWESELYSTNKVTAYMFALPILTMSIGVLKWSEQELASLDVKARKILNMTGSLHSKGNIKHL